MCFGNKYLHTTVDMAHLGTKRLFTLPRTERVGRLVGLSQRCLSRRNQPVKMGTSSAPESPIGSKAVVGVEVSTVVEGDRFARVVLVVEEVVAGGVCVVVDVAGGSVVVVVVVDVVVVGGGCTSNSVTSVCSTAPSK